MTGEVTLRGRVLEIGGIKEKVIAAPRGGIKTVIIPKANKKDLEDIPKYVLSDLKFVYVDQVDQVLKVALVRPLRSEEVKETDLLAIPYFAWANRGQSSMRVWIPKSDE